MIVSMVSVLIDFPVWSAENLAFAATTLPSGFTQDLVVAGLAVPTSLAFLPDGRVLIAEQRGTVRIVKNATLVSTPVIDLRDRVNVYGDRGLLGLAIDPSFATTGYMYLLYTYEHDGARPDGPKSARLARYTMVGDTAAPGSERILLGANVGDSCEQFPLGADCLPSDYIGHTIADVKVAPDGSLFVSTGDAATSETASEPALRAQNLDSLAGKMLRIDRATGAGLSNNPFWTGDARNARSKVWAYGFRNPFRFTFRPGTSAPVIGDVGWGTWEEVNLGAAGANFGWPCYEGPDIQWSYWSMPPCQALYARGAAAVTLPLFAYPRSEGSTVAGGVFYTGSGYPAQYQGAYFFADFSRQWIRYLRLDSTGALVGGVQPFATGVDYVVDMETGPDGDLYYLANSGWSSSASGELRHIRFSAGAGVSPTVTAVSPAGGATDVAPSSPVTATFSEAMDPASLTAATVTLTRNGATSPVAAAVQYDAVNRVATLVPTVPLDGRASYTTRIRGGAGGARDAGGTPLSTDKTWTFAIAEVANTPPAATISSPSAALTFKVGDTITYSGGATDAEDGTLSPAQLSWRVLLRHCPGFGTDCHIHPFTAQEGVSGGSFTVPDHGDGLSFDIVLTATDRAGQTGTASVTVKPQTIQVTLATEPSGLPVIWGGEAPAAAPLVRTAVVGSRYTITAPSPQNGRTFTAWSDGGARQHDVIAPTSAVTYTARFVEPTTTLTVSREGDGTGTVTSTPGGVLCGETCRASYAAGTHVVLRAETSTGSTFAGWGGACVSAGASPTCTLDLQRDGVVTARFQAEHAGVQVGVPSEVRPSGDAGLIATLTARPSCGRIQRIQFGEQGIPFANARVSNTASGGPIDQTHGFVYTPSGEATAVSFSIHRVIPSGGATVSPIRLYDDCGEWRTFVGGGPDAFR
jgi:glucose/arabinose dehydrogenase